MKTENKIPARCLNCEGYKDLCNSGVLIPHMRDEK